MKPFFGILLGLVGTIVLLLILAAVALPLLFDEDDLKQAVAREVREETGRELSLAGDLDFSVFPWLALEVNNLSLSNAPGFGEQPFARIGKARAGIALMPLLRRQISLDRITLHGLELALEVDERGVNNWDDLAAHDDGGATEDAGPGTFSSQGVAGLDIRDARFDFRDRQAGLHYRLSNVALQTGALGSGQAVPIELMARFEDVTADLNADIRLAAAGVFDLEAGRHALDDIDLALSLDTREAPRTIDLRAPRLDVDLEAQTLNLAAFTADLAGLQLQGGLSATKILDEPALNGTLEAAEFSPAEWMRALGMQPPATTDPSVLQRARFSSAFRGTTSAIELTGFDLTLDQSRLQGEVSVQVTEPPQVRFDLAIDTIDVDRYLEPAGAEASGPAGDVAIPQQELRDQDLEGRLTAGQLRLAGVEFTNAQLGLVVRNGRLRLHPLTGDFYGGRYTGDIRLDGSADVPVLSLDERIDSVAFRELVADLVDSEALSGTAGGFVRLSGQGTTSDAVLSSLQGDLELALAEGALEGINIWYEIRRGMALYKGLPPPEPEPDRTVFSRMQLVAGVDGGVLSTRELAGELPFLTVRGNGTVDLAGSQVDLGMVAVVSSAPELADDPLAAELSGRSLPFRVSGALDDPAISIDWEALLRGEATDMLLDKLGLGPKPAPDDSGTAPAEEVAPEDQIKDTATHSILDMLRGKDKNGGQDEGGR